ncbi:two-component regulator propeller domain-containing protein [Caldimonas sp. KR1-144]|uniref:sensor histidine kinase n=1 Tax=Caldimonas sp. KR1-144 TaxID=3400911 RepID=UPI003C03FC10
MLWFVALALPLLPNTAVGSDLPVRPYHHTAWRASSGTPTGAVNMAQTPDGFLWLATPTGLYRFDGLSFEKIDTLGAQRLLSNNVSGIHADPSGRLIIGYRFGGVSILQNGRLRHFGQAEGVPRGSAWSFTSGPDGELWGGFAGGIARFDGGRWHVAKFGRSDVATGIVSFDRDGTLWNSREDGVFYRRRGTSEFARVEADLGRRPIVTDDGVGQVWAFDRDHGALQRLVWAGDRYTVDGAKLKLAYPAITELLTFDQEGNAWLPGESGVLRLPAIAAASNWPNVVAEAYDVAFGLSGSAVTAVLPDREGNVWVATDGGLDRFRRSKLVMAAPPVNTNASAIAPATGGDIWMTSFQDGLLRLGAGTTRKFEVGKRATSLYRSPGGALWVAAPDQLWRVDADGQQLVPLPAGAGALHGGTSLDMVQAITEDGNGALWLSVTRRGVFKRTGGGWEVPQALGEFGRQTAISLTSDPQGRVWLGYTDSRAVRVDRDGGRLALGAAEGLQIGNVLSIFAGDTHAWFGGDRGLAYQSEGGKVLELAIDDALGLSGISGIVESRSGDLWLGDASGLIHVRRAQWQRAVQSPGYRMVIRRYDYSDGLVGKPSQLRRIPTVVEAEDGKIWMATEAGIALVDPARMSSRTEGPATVIKSVSADGTRYSPEDAVGLPPNTGTLQIDYTATSLSQAERTQFAYRLEGYEKAWHSAGTRRQALYTHLPPGDYVFRVGATDADGVTGKDTASVRISVRPAYWQTGWFAILCAMAALGMVSLAYRQRLRRVTAAVRARVEARVIERERIARDLHDTVLQGVTALMLHVRAAVEQMPKESPIKNALEQALASARATLTEGRDRVVDLRSTGSLDKLSKGNLAEAVADACEELGRTYCGPSYRVIKEGRVLALSHEQMVEVFSIVREALTNAFRHAGASQIEVLISYQPDCLRVSVQDDGVGFDAGTGSSSSPPGHFGLLGMQERARGIAAALEIRSGPTGTELLLTLPVHVSAFRLRVPFLQRRLRTDTTTRLRPSQRASAE